VKPVFSYFFLVNMPMRIGEHITKEKIMPKELLKTVTAVELAKHIAKAKATQAQKLRTVQLPVKAHTSGTAKAAIIVSLVTSGLALSGVLYNIYREAKKESDRKGDELFNRSFPTTKDVKEKVANVVADAKETVTDVKDKVAEAPVVKKVTRTAKTKTDEVAAKPEVKEAADTVAEKTAEVAKAAREAKKDAEDDLGFPKK
jgi:uncharacterized protein with von Willebrand factor type A (vWA) domain